MNATQTHELIRTYLHDLGAVLIGGKDARADFRPGTAEAVSEALMDAYSLSETMFLPSDTGCGCGCGGGGGCGCGCRCDCDNHCDCGDGAGPQLRCNTNSDCPQGEICDGGRCRPHPHHRRHRGFFRCNTNSDCPQGEVCRGGRCRPRHASRSSSYSYRCNTNSDCPQGEVCRGGRCIPRPFRLVMAPLGVDDSVPAMPEEVVDYLDRIALRFAAGLEKNPHMAADVRDVLAWTYAGSTRCEESHKCEMGAECPEGWVCVGGCCVPVPYVFQAR